MPIVNHIVRVINLTDTAGDPRVLSVAGADITGSDGKSQRFKVPIRSYSEIDLHEIQFDRLLCDSLSLWMDSGEARVELDGVIQTTAQVGQWKYGIAADVPVTGLSLKFNGAPLHADVKTLNFVNGPDRTDADPGVDAQMNALLSTQGDLYIHPPNYVSHFNTTDGTSDARPVPNVAAELAQTRRVSNPNANPGGNFEITGWTAGNSYTGFHYTDPLTYSLPGEFSMLDYSSTFNVQIYRADTSTLITNHLTTSIGAGGYSATQNGITITVSGVGANGPKYKATFTASINVAAVLATASLSGGKYRVVITHNNGLETPASYISDMFLDTNAPGDAQDPVLSNPTIAQAGTLNDKWLSGIRYYDLFTTFNVNIASIALLNAKSFPVDLIQVDTTQYGIGGSSVTLNSGDLTGWATDWDDTSSYVDTGAQLDQSSYRYISSVAPAAYANVEIQPLYTGAGWATTAPIQKSVDSDVCIDTWGTESTDTYEPMTDEARRTTAFDLAGAYTAGGVWNSTQDMTSYDDNQGAMVQAGELKKSRIDWSSYLPAGSPDYTTIPSTCTYYRQFVSDGGAYRSVRFIFQVGSVGTLANLISALETGVGARLYMFIPGGQWRVRAEVHNPFNFFSFNSAIRNGGVYSNAVTVGNYDSSDASSIVASFGNRGMNAARNKLDVMLELDDNSLSVGAISVQFQGA